MRQTCTSAIVQRSAADALPGRGTARPPTLAQTKEGEIMKHVWSIGLAVLGTLAVAGIAAASASAELPEYMMCGKAAKVDKEFVGHYSSALCTEESKVATGGEYELEKGFKKATFTAKSGRSILATPEIAERIECKSTSTSGELSGTKQVKDVVITASGCEASGARCNSAGAKSGHIVTNALKGEFGYIAGKGTKTPTVGLLLSQESTAYASEFTSGPIISEVTGDVNAVSAEATYTFRQSGGEQQFTSFEGGGMFEDEWHWEFNIGKGFEPEGGNPSGLELTAVSSQEPFELKA
jgi:hypothetical protein